MARPDQSQRDRKGGDTRLQWPTANFPHGIQFIFKDYNYDEFIGESPIGGLSGDGTGSGQVWKTANNNRRAVEKDALILELPIPKSLTDSTGVSISGFERSFVETFLTTQAAKATGDPLGTAKALGDAIAKSAGGIVSGDLSGLGLSKEGGETFKRLIATIGTSVLGAVGLGEKSIGAVMGSVQNPQSTLYFDGVDLRSFSFTWQLYPQDAQEAENIKQIVRKVKSKILPQTQGLNGESLGEGTGALTSSLSKAFLKFPSVVFINLLGVDESHYIKFKPCMCKGINIDYSDNGSILTIAEGGVPYGISIGMDFMELEIQTAEDYGASSAGDMNIPEVVEEEGEQDG